jgi:ribosomal protein L19
MKLLFISRLYITLCLLFAFTYRTVAQTQSSASILQQIEKGLFDTDDVLQLVLKGNIRKLLNDRYNVPKNYSLVLTYTKEDSSEMVMPVEVKTRGHFRRLKENCIYPPLLIQFPKEGSHLSSIFREQRKLKLVMPCAGDEYIIHEWLVYKIFNLITPKSFRVRLVKVKLEEEGNKKTIAPFYGILLEEEKQMAKRNGLVSVERKLRPEQTQTDAFLSMAVFEYLIGNTDWSIQYLQNIKLLASDSTSIPFPVPYDFDHAGIVYAPYARPAEELQMRSVRERRYRGYCVQDMKVFDAVIEQYNRLKNDIYRIYTDCTLLDAKYIKSTIQFLDEFYTTINNPKALQKEFGYPCDKNGTGNVVIKGLKEN